MRRMETAEFAIFFSFSKLIWPLSVSWIIFACHHGYGGKAEAFKKLAYLFCILFGFKFIGVVNSFLSIKSFVPLTRLSYCAYLIHPCMILTIFQYQMTSLP